MKHFSRCGAALFALSLIALSTGPAPAVIAPMGGGGGESNLSGMYSGTVSDSVLGSGTATANFAFSGGSPHGGGGGDPLGGWMNFTYGSTTYSNPTSASHKRQCGDGDVHVNWGGCGGGDVRANWGGGGGGGNNWHGVFVQMVASSACVFDFKASWNPSSYQLSGDYSARVGCSGESGTFDLTQQCYYQEFQMLRRNSGSGPGACT